MFGRGLFKEHLCKTFVQNICNEIAIKACFTFPITYRSMETKLSWQWKHISNGNKNTIFIEANVMNISAKFQLHPPYGFCGDDFFYTFFTNLAFQLPWQPIKFSSLDKIHMLHRELLKEHFCITFVNIPAPIAQLVECPLQGTGGHRFNPGPRHTKVVKTGTSWSSLGTQTYGVELGLVDPVSG